MSVTFRRREHELVRMRKVCRERFRGIGHRMYIIYPPASAHRVASIAGEQSFSLPTQQTEA